MKDANKAQRESQEQLTPWVRILALSLAGDAIDKELRSEQARLAYHNSDGRTSREVAKSADVGRETITACWKKWARLGIVTPVSVKGGGTRYKKTLELSDLGLPLPKGLQRSKAPKNHSSAQTPESPKEDSNHA